MAELRKELKERDLPSDGLKAVLIRRLEEFDEENAASTSIDEDSGISYSFILPDCNMNHPSKITKQILPQSFHRLPSETA